MRQIYQYDPAIGYKFIPDLKARMLHPGGGYLIRTNHDGFQSDHEFTSSRSPDTQRILLFGDSFTAGEGVSNGFRYSDQLERSIPDLEIFNYGLPASGTDQQYLMYREYAQGVDHDLLVVGVFVENILRVASRYRQWLDNRGRSVLYAKPYFVLENGNLELRGSPPQKAPLTPDDLAVDERQYIAASVRFPKLKELFNQISGSRPLKHLMERVSFRERLLKLVGYQPIKTYDDPENETWLVMRAILEEWIRGHDRPVLIVPIPLFHHVAGIADASAYQQRFQEATTAAGGHYFDPLDGMKQPSLEQCRALFFEDGHLTRQGHRVLADSLAPEIERLLDRKEST